jgi:glutathione synthase/RimK-type ligase-like ATP-grasp enzyme
MRILLSDGSGLTARQTARELAARGHHVEVLSPDPLCLCRFTRDVRRVRRVPAYGADPWAWLTAALSAYRAGGFDVLFPTQEQVAVLAAAPEVLESTGVVTAVPTFAALAAVQDKVSAFRTLSRLGVPQPPSAVGAGGWESFPCFVKDPIGTASGGVRRVANPGELALAAPAGRDVLVQATLDGPLAMCQAVFDGGRLVAFHANLRTAEGANGGASRKRSVELADAREGLERIGADLAWHGALSADVIVTRHGVSFIDINPRLVEPANARRAGVDLVGALLEIATGGHPSLQLTGQPDLKTHQVLLAILGAAQRGRGRRGVAGELMAALRRSGDYAGSEEELTPVRGDPIAATPVLLATVATLLRPAWWRWFVSSSVDSYALSPDGWRQVLDRVARPAAARS